MIAQSQGGSDMRGGLLPDGVDAPPTGPNR